MLDSLVSNVKKRATKAMTSPAARKVMADPRFQRAVMKAINVRADLHNRIEKQVKGFATSYSLVTREDVAKLRRTIRELERTVTALQGKLAQQGGNDEAAPVATEQPTRRRRPAPKA